MYEEALGIEIEFNIQPYTVLLQRWVSKTYPGGGPQWTNPPDDLDPTTSYLQNLTPGGATNNLSYDFQPMTDIANEMRVTLDREQRRDMAFEAQRILLGTHPDHGVEGLGNRSRGYEWYLAGALVAVCATSRRHACSLPTPRIGTTTHGSTSTTRITPPDDYPRAGLNMA